MLDSPHFEPRISLFDDPSENNAFDLSREDSPSFFTSQDAASPSVVQSSSSNFEQDAPGRHPESYRLETPSPSSGNFTMGYEKYAKFNFLLLRTIINLNVIINYSEAYMGMLMKTP